MGLSRHFKKLVDLAALLVEDALDGWATNESRAALQERLRASAERGAELALKVAQLEDKVDELRFNGPTLYRDEVELLESMVRTMQEMIKACGFTDLAEAGKNLQITRHLLDRCDHMPITEGELEEQIKSVLDGTAQVYEWGDPGVDVEPPHEHDHPPVGFAKCTRSWPHEGPCAHPYARDVENWDDIPF